MNRTIRYFALLLGLILSFGVFLQSFQPAKGTNRWIVMGKMQSARAGACSVALPEGRVLITGGQSAQGVLNSAEMFDGSGAFISVAPMSSVHFDHVCAALDDGRVLVAGGSVSGGGPSSVAEVYDPQGNTWTVTGPMTMARSGASASVLKSGRVLIAGGENNGSMLATLETFDPVNNVFEPVFDSMSAARKNHAAAVLKDGRVLIAGGSSGTSPVDSADLFDPATGTVSRAGRLLAARAGLSATTLLDGTVLLAGGIGESGDLSSAELYDPEKRTFTAAATLQSARHGQKALLLPDNNSVLIVGGMASGTASSAAELYIPWQRVSKPIAGLLSARSGAAASPLSGRGKLMIAGGQDGKAALSSTEVVSYATVTTDKTDYLPGETVVVSGTGWQPGETVNLVFHETNGPDDDVTYQAVADDAGNISNTRFAPDSHDYGVVFTLTATGISSNLTAQTMFTDGANLDSCANGPASAPTNCEWVNGNLTASKSHYVEGGSVPFRLVIDGLSIGTHTVTIAWDTTKGGKHAFDYLTSYNRTMDGLNPPNTANPCLGIAPCAGPATFPIPTDPNVSGAGVPQIPGLFSIFNGGVSSISAYSFASGNYAGDSTEQLTLTFTANSPKVVLAWAAHVSTRADWTSALSAISIGGSPYHMRLLAVDGGGGNQDHQIQAEAIIFPGTITIKKHATPQSTQSFSFTASPAPLTSFSLVDDGITPANATKIFPPTTTFTTYNITETSLAGWKLNSISCVNNDSSTGAFSGSTNVATGAVSINLVEGQAIQCDYVNERLPAHLKLVKSVVNTNGGSAVAADWTLTATGPQPIAGAGGVESDVTPGTYVLTESTGPAGYSASNWACTAGTLSGNSLVLGAGVSATCTITNTSQAAHLTLVKTVDNTNGGTKAAADWTLTATGTTTITGKSGEAAVSSAVVQPGIYVLSESGPAGYDASAWTCVGGTQAGNQITLALGESASCSITNTSQKAHLTLVKTLDQTNGGTEEATAWTLNAGGPTPITGTTGSGPVSNAAVNAGAYTLSESGPSGYTASVWTCTGATVTNSQVTLTPGQSTTCTITNTSQIAHLTLVKTLDQTNGGTDLATAWTLNASGPTPISGPTGDGAVTNAPVKAGHYTLTEINGPAGYTASAWACTGGTQVGNQVTLAPGESASCSITNTSQAAHLTLTKTLDQNNGGTDLATAWTLSAISGPNSISGPTGATVVTAAPVKPGTYNLSESGPSGYTAGSWVCTGGSQSGSQITIALGQDVSCGINNTSQLAHLTLTKSVNNDNGGSAVATAWTLSATGGPSTITGTTGTATVTNAGVKAGTYTLSESGGPAGYTASAWSCIGGTLSGSQITLGPGESASCTITNSSQKAHLKLVKVVDNTAGGSSVTTDWTLSATGPQPLSGAGGAESDVIAGTYTLTESAGPVNYTPGAWICTAGSLVGNSLALSPGQSSVCTITNTATPAHLSLTKFVVNVPAGGTAVAANWTLTATGPSIVSGPAGFALTTVKAGTYTLSESGGVLGYAASAWSCSAGSLIGNQLTLGAGQTANCSITNTAIAPTITVNKVLVPVSGNSDTFNLQIDGVTKTVSAVGNGGSTGPIAVSAGVPHLAGETGASLSDYVATYSGDCNQNGSIAPLGLGQSATCTITNTKTSWVRVVKSVEGGALTAADSFTFQLRQGASTSAAGTTLESGAANLANGGILNFTTKLDSSQTYQLCETLMPGWKSTLPNFFILYNSSGDNSTVCTNIGPGTLAPGQTYIFTIDNTRPPGGLARTIGFWKNWSSCTNGGQFPYLDQNLPATMGILTLQGSTTITPARPNSPDCQKAFNILDKSDIKSGKKMASDPAYNMAAQLLAAFLNYHAGAYRCAASDSVVNAAQALLVKYNFNGTGSYTSGPNKMTAADAALANSLALQLDLYNNNNFQFCGI
jgi:hypothetical protein